MALKSPQRKRALTEGMEANYADTKGLLFDTGGRREIQRKSVDCFPREHHLEAQPTCLVAERNAKRQRSGCGWPMLGANYMWIFSHCLPGRVCDFIHVKQSDLLTAFASL